MKLNSFFMVVITLAVSASMTLASVWTPPDNPNADTILKEAVQDAQAKRYEIALAKHVWFYENVHKKRVYEEIQKTSKNRNLDPKISEDSTKSFRNDVATLVAILSLNDRKPQASQIAALAKKDLEDAQFHKELEAALQGTVPTP